MERNSAHFTHISLLALVTAVVVVTVAPANGQSSSSLCTGAMIRSFNPCIGFLTSGSNLSSPTSGCCSALKDLMSNGQDCLCLIVTGGVPFQVPFNRSLAISLPRACRMSGVPVECKATQSPIPAPDPGSPPSSIIPGLSPPSPRGPFSPQPFTPPSLSPPGSDVTPPSDGDIVPTLTPPGMRPTLTSSAEHSVHSSSTSLLVAMFGAILLMCH